ncbi:hypothetical protein [Endothiovibrio diazotrophicus]
MKHQYTAQPHPALLAWRRKAYRPSVALPAVGAIYRDWENRSLLVLTLHGDQILIEYADGETRTIGITDWHTLRPVRSIC